MRGAFVKALLEIAGKDPKVYLLTGDLGFRILEPFIEKFPNQFLNVGVAEANLITAAAGLTSLGFKPFVYSIATFATLRPYEQIRNDICLQNLNVKIVGVGGGLAYSKAGPTHHSLEDVALMRTLPNMTIISPSCPYETYYVTKKLHNEKGPAYLRLERNPPGEISIQNSIFRIKKGIKIKKGKELALIASGNKIETIIEVEEILRKKGVNAGVYAFTTIKPLDTRMLQQISKEYSLIVTVEEHYINGGLGTAVLEFLSSKQPKPPAVLRLGVKNIFTPISAEYDKLIEFNKLTPPQISRSIIAHLHSSKQYK